MRPTTALVWKEWHDARVYLWVGLGAFLGLPLVGAVQAAMARHVHRFELTTTPWVIALGGVLAVLVGVGVTTPDRRPKLEDFWRSRPIRVGRWLAVKYAVGLAVVLVACGLPAAAEMAVGGTLDDSVVTLLTFLPFFWTAIFSLAFLAGCLVPRPSHAATIALAAMLLVYLLPVVLPPLSWMDVADFSDRNVAWAPRVVGHGALHDWLQLWGRRQFAFAGGMLCVAAASWSVAVVGVGRGWRVESGRRTMYGAVATALLLLFASAAYQLATNLPMLQKVEFPADEEVTGFYTDGASDYVLTRRPSPPPRVGLEADYAYQSRPVIVQPGGIAVGPAFDVPAACLPALVRWGQYARVRGVVYTSDWVERPAAGQVNDADYLKKPGDAVLVWADARTGARLGRLPLWVSPRAHGNTRAYAAGDRLYLYGDRLDVFDVARPDHPRLLSDEPWTSTGGLRGSPAADDSLEFYLLPLPGLPPAQRLAATLENDYGNAPAFDGRVLCTVARGGSDGVLTSYCLASLTDTIALFGKTGEYRPTMLQRMAGGAGTFWNQPHLSNGLLYIDGFNSGTAFNSSVSIADPYGDRPMRMVGHFAAPGASVIQPLPDGRAIVGGGHMLWLVGGPPRKR